MIRIRLWYFAVALGLSLTGCMMPAYRMPAGFSSTYFRHLYSDDPRAMQRQLSSLGEAPSPDGMIDEDSAPRRYEPGRPELPVPQPLDQQQQHPQAEQPDMPVEPHSHPSPPAPLPESEASSPKAKPVQPHSDEQPIDRQPVARALSNMPASLTY